MDITERKKLMENIIRKNLKENHITHMDFILHLLTQIEARIEFIEDTDERAKGYKDFISNKLVHPFMIDKFLESSLFIDYIVEQLDELN